MIRLKDFIAEAERGTKNAKEIANTLKTAGYKKLGEGVDATVWTKDDGSVLKIIMPQPYNTKHAPVRKDRPELAADTFMKFYDFVQKHKELRCLPRFKQIQGESIAKFSLRGRDYLQISMEKLNSLKKGSAEELLVWHLSDYAAQNTDWNTVVQELQQPEASMHYKPKEQERFKFFMSDKDKLLEHKMLYTTMKLLHVTGSLNNMNWDLHTENAMQRADGTIVIVDPWLTF
jgi:hypothetical protein